uniref:Pentatricopeptide repeat-containing protein n=1 Tax=Rhizophora mucronata TaxID=61149 RepID=A0A2P2IM57_RHIMU
MSSTTPSALPIPIPTHSHDTNNKKNSSQKHSLLTIAPPPSPTLKTPTIRTRLSRLCQEGRPHLARQLFDTIPRPTTVLWNTIIIGFVCNNLPLEAILFYSRLKNASSPIKCDSYTYSSTLKACAETGNLLLGRAVHCHFIRCLEYPSRIVYNSLLSMYSSCLSQMDCSKDLDFSKYDVVRKVFGIMRKRNVVAWNTLISWYVKTERYMQALKQFRLMMKKEIKPSPVSFVNVFPALSKIGDYRNSNMLYGMLVKLGSEYMNDLFAVSSAICLFAELSCLDSARKVFDCCLDKNTEVWNSMIGGYVQNNHPLEGIELFLKARETEETILDEVTFLSALNAASQLQCLDLAQQLHAFLIKNLTVLPVIILNAIIVVYSRCNAIDMSFNVFEKMLERDVVSWNTMISAFVQNGFDDEALMLVHEMQKQDIAIDPVTVTSLLSAASNLRNDKIGKQTHAYLLRHGIRFDGMDSYLIDMYAKSGLIRTAAQIFEKNHMNNRDQAIWNAMISGYTQHGLVEEAFVTFRQMVEQKVMPNAVTMAAILPACNPVGSIDLGKQLHGVSIRHLLDHNVFVSTALVDMYSKLGAINYAESVFFLSPERNSVTYTTMILGYGQNGMGEKALYLFNSMKTSGSEPDAVTFVAVLSACSYAGFVDEGLQIFQSMKRDYKIKPSTQHYCCVADMLGKAGRVVEAYEFVEQLGDEGNVLEIWGSLLGACRLHGHIGLREMIAKKLHAMDRVEGLAGYQVLLSNIYAEEGIWENVDKLRKEMREKGLRKEVGCSWINIGGHISHFVSKDPDHPLYDQIDEMLMRLTMEMRQRIDYEDETDIEWSLS